MQPFPQRVGVIITSALLVAVTGIGVGIGLARPRPTAPSTTASATVTSTSAGASLTGDDLAAIDAVLAADQTKADGGRLPAARLRRLAAWKHLVHATVVVDLQKAGLTSIQLDHGTISALNATSITIAEAGGGSVTVALSGETRIRRAGAKALVGALKTGDVVFAMSKVDTGGATAYLVVVPRT